MRHPSYVYYVSWVHSLDKGSATAVGRILQQRTTYSCALKICVGYHVSATGTVLSVERMTG